MLNSIPYIQSYFETVNSLKILAITLTRLIGLTLKKQNKAKNEHRGL
jgi:hypothetical protein